MNKVMLMLCMTISAWFPRDVYDRLFSDPEVLAVRCYNPSDGTVFWMYRGTWMFMKDMEKRTEVKFAW